MDEVTRITVRLPADMAALLRTLANQESRSLHGQIMHMLRRSLMEETGMVLEQRLGPKPARPGE